MLASWVGKMEGRGQGDVGRRWLVVCGGEREGEARGGREGRGERGERRRAEGKGKGRVIETYHTESHH